MDSFRSGKLSGGRSSNFSQTCTLLSQFLKQNGSFQQLNQSLNMNLQTKGHISKTMDLFPIEKPGQNLSSINPNTPMIFPGKDEAYKKSNLSVEKPNQETSQMTIFYAGQVIVLDNFPATKAKEIMMLASKSSGTAHNAPFATPLAAQTGPTESGVDDIVAAFGTDLPIARKKSLVRFLEKRKDRIIANAPYQVYKSKSSAANPVNASPWLGLAHDS